MKNIIRIIVSSLFTGVVFGRDSHFFFGRSPLQPFPHQNPMLSEGRSRRVAGILLAVVLMLGPNAAPSQTAMQPVMVDFNVPGQLNSLFQTVRDSEEPGKANLLQVAAGGVTGGALNVLPDEPPLLYVTKTGQPIDLAVPYRLSILWKFDLDQISSPRSREFLTLGWHDPANAFRRFAWLRLSNGKGYVSYDLGAASSAMSTSRPAKLASGHWHRTTLTFGITDPANGKITSFVTTTDCGTAGNGPEIAIPQLDYKYETTMSGRNRPAVLHPGFSAARSGGNVMMDNLQAFTLPPLGAPPPPPDPPAPPTASRGIVLDRTWHMPNPVKNQAAEDLGVLLSPFGRGAQTLEAFPDLEIYPGVTYLMPLDDAKSALGINQRGAARNKVVCSGLPKDSLFYHAFDGVFEGHFNKLYLITDLEDQVAAVMLVAESPRKEFVEVSNSKPDWHFHNFILARSKATTRLWIGHTASFYQRGEWRQYRIDSSYGQPDGPVRLLRIDSCLIDPGTRDGAYKVSGWRPLESARLYLAKPMIELILFCVGKR